MSEGPTGEPPVHHYTLWYHNPRTDAKGPRLDLEASSLDQAKDLYICEVDNPCWQRFWAQVREGGIGEDPVYLDVWAHMQGGEVGQEGKRTFGLVRGGKWGGGT
jgi:hypothetical protein